jgi:hypothetical protein
MAEAATTEGVKELEFSMYVQLVESRILVLDVFRK